MLPVSMSVKKFVEFNKEKPSLTANKVYRHKRDNIAISPGDCPGSDLKNEQL